MNGDGDAALTVILGALEREAKRARLSDAIVDERDALKRSQHDALFNEWKAKDKERDVSERDVLLRERDARISDLHKAQVLLTEQLRELEELRRLRPVLERRAFDATQEAQALQNRMATQTAALTSHFSAKLSAAREAALGELEGCAKRLLSLVPMLTDTAAADEAAAVRTLEACEVIDEMRLVVAKQLI